MNTVKTTINLPASLFHEAKIFAAIHQKTVTELIRDGLQIAIGKKNTAPHPNTFATFLDTFTPFSVLTDSEKETLYREYLSQKYE